MRPLPTCDICKRQGSVTDLKEEYKTDRIVDLCDNCLDEVEKCHAEVMKMQQKMLHNLVKRFLLALKAKKGGGNG